VNKARREGEHPSFFGAIMVESITSYTSVLENEKRKGAADPGHHHHQKGGKVYFRMFIIQKRGPWCDYQKPAVWKHTPQGLKTAHSAMYLGYFGAFLTV
jgi:hypothetical protein